MFRNRPRSLLISLMFVLIFALSACSPLSVFAEEPVQTETPEYQEDVLVEELQVLMLESFPVQVQVDIRGQLPDACSIIEMVEQASGDDFFIITLHNARQPNMRCAPQPTPFEESVQLDVLGLPAGTYTVTVHGVETTFDLPVDNILIEE
jgi:hypothetical protein